MTKQTAIQWLSDQLGITNDHILKQAKEMEKQQIIDAAIDGYDEAISEYETYKTPDDYYNETYGGNK